MDLSEEILAELRELRTDYNTHARETGERLAKLEEQMHDLCGNGNPGRIAKLETAVSKLQTWRKYVIGYVSGCTVVLGGIGGFLAWLLKG